MVYHGMLRSLSTLIANWLASPILRAGLYENDITPSRALTISSVVPATFAGYVGLRSLGGWKPPTIDGDWAVTRASPVEWTYNGGSPAGRVYGYYVVDGDGELVWLEPRAEGPLWLVNAGAICSVHAAINLGSLFPT